MKLIKVTFTMDCSDPDDPSGMTPFHFEHLHAALSSEVGAFDIETEVVEIVEENVERKEKPKRK